MALSETELSYTSRFVEAAEWLKKHQKISVRDIMGKLGLKEQYFTRYKNKAQALPHEKIEVLSKLFNINKRWILTGEGEMIIDYRVQVEKESFEERILAELRNSLEQPIEVETLKNNYKLLYDKYAFVKRELAEANEDLKQLKLEYDEIILKLEKVNKK